VNRYDEWHAEVDSIAGAVAEGDLPEPEQDAVLAKAVALFGHVLVDIAQSLDEIAQAPGVAR
jgi:hypothetical protein